MCCPQCGAHTEVSEKRGPFRDRRCTNAACRVEFTTREQVLKPLEHGRLCARTRATQIEIPPRVPAVGEKVGSTSRPGSAPPSRPAVGASGEGEKQRYLHAEVGA
jgi:hypothetical protein